MKSFFFGSSNRQLYGVYHAPRASHARARETGILLCYPGVQEYNAAHWAFRKLAGHLARDGFHVLRFDWHGTGDSAGDVRDGHPDTWLEDLATASQELRDSSGVSQIHVVGMRLGAALATLACAKGVAIGELVLWEPVVSGRKYVTELEAQDSRENFQLLHAVPWYRDELVGYAFPRRLRDALVAVDLCQTAPAAAQRVAIFASTPRRDYLALRDAVTRGGRPAAFYHVPEDAPRSPAEHASTALLSNKILVAMADYLAGRPAEGLYPAEARTAPKGAGAA